MSLGTVELSNTEEDDIPVVLVIAPGSGIGKVLVPYLVENGFRVVSMGSEKSSYFVEFLINQGLDLEHVEIDYFSEESIIEGFAKLRARVRKLDGMVHLAGGSLYSRAADEYTYEEFKKVVDLNLTSAYLIGKEVFKWMKETNGGNIVFFGSTTGKEPSPKKLAYAVSKAGVHMLGQAFALEGSEFGIICNTIAPGYVMTDRHIEELNSYAEKNNLTIEEAIIAKVRNKNPLGGVLNVEDILPIVKLLLETSKMQGQVLTVDLGQTNL